ncbi:MAG: DMT family transporter [Planctomycetota bacterium]
MSGGRTAPAVASHAAGGQGVGVLTIAMTLAGWSAVPLFLEHFSRLIDVWTSNGWRYGFSALLWAPVLVFAAWRRRLPRGLFRAALVPSIVNALGQVCFVWAHYEIEPGLLTFGLRGQLLFAAVGAYLLFPVERPIIRTRGYLIGMALLIAGTSAAILLGDQPFRGAHAFGVVLALLAGGLFAGYGISVRWFMNGVSSVYAFAAISQFTAAAMIVLMLALGERGGLSALSMTAPQVGLLLLSAVIGIALGHVFYYVAIARLGVAVSAGVLQLQPFLVAIGSFALFGERLTVAQWTGGTVAVGGAAMMLWVQRALSRAALRRSAGRALSESEPGA